jgi:hypothetical protein
MKLNKGFTWGAGVSLALTAISWPIAQYALNASEQELSLSFSFSYWMVMFVAHLFLYGIYIMVDHACYNVIDYDIDAKDVLIGGAFVLSFIMIMLMNHLVVVGGHSESEAQAVVSAFFAFGMFFIYVIIRAIIKPLD